MRRYWEGFRGLTLKKSWKKEERMRSKTPGSEFRNVHLVSDAAYDVARAEQASDPK